MSATLPNPFGPNEVKHLHQVLWHCIKARWKHLFRTSWNFNEPDCVRAIVAPSDLAGVDPHDRLKQLERCRDEYNQVYEAQKGWLELQDQAVGLTKRGLRQTVWSSSSFATKERARSGNNRNKSARRGRNYDSDPQKPCDPGTEALLNEEGTDKPGALNSLIFRLNLRDC